MTVQRQRIHLLLATTAAAFGFACSPVAAQGSYPNKTVLMIVPAAAGMRTMRVRQSSHAQILFHFRQIKIPSR